MKEMGELLRFVCTELEKRNIAYMLSGSMALNAYSVARPTRDIDLVIELNTANFGEFSTIFAARNCYFHQESALVEVHRRGMFNVIDWTLDGKIDFIVRRDDAFQQMEFSRRVRMTVLDDFDCWIISAEDLVLAKLIWIQELFSDRQLDDIKHIVRDYKALDRVYVADWISRLKLTHFNILKQ